MTKQTTVFQEFSNNKTVFVSGLNKKILQAELYKIINEEFDRKVETVYINENRRYETNIAYINMKDHESAKQVIEKFNGRVLHEQKINCFWNLSNRNFKSENETNLFIKGIKKEIQQNELQEVFKKYGEIVSVKLSTNEKNESNGFGYVKYLEKETIEKVFEKKEEIKEIIGNEEFSINKFEKPQQNASQTNLYIGNIDGTITEEQFVKYFETFGKIKESANGKKLYAYYKVKESEKNKGFVNFETAEDAEKALKSPKENVLGNGTLVIAFYKTKTERKREYKKKDEEIKTIIMSRYKDYNLYIKTKLKSEEINTSMIEEQFKDCGEIFSIKVKYNKQCLPTEHVYICMTNMEGRQNVEAKCKELSWECSPYYTYMQRNAQASFANYPFMMNPFNGNVPMNYHTFNNPILVSLLQSLTNPHMAPYWNQQNVLYDGRMSQRQGHSNKSPKQGDIKKGTGKRKQNGRDGQKQRKPKQEDEKQKQNEKVLEKEVKEVPQEEEKNELGDALFDYISEKFNFDEELTGKITGVLLDSIEFNELRQKLNENTKELDAIIVEIKENLENMQQQQ